MKILDIKSKTHNEIVETAVETLSNGGLIIYPTETCYGVGVDATNKEAVNKLLKYKSRREGKPISIAVSDQSMASQYVEINEIAQNLYENYLPGPITVVSKSLGKTAKGVESEFGTLGVRIPAYPLVLEITKQFGKPITSTSANMSYMSRPYNIQQILKDLPKKYQEMIDLIIDGGKLPKNEPSTVVDTTMNNMNVMRAGKILLNNSIGSKKAILSAFTKSAEETENFGSLNMLKFIDDRLEKPLVFLLSGELGAGKTQFAKGIAKKLGIKEIIKSPTYNIVNEYSFSVGGVEGVFAHIDTWRIDGIKELENISLEKYFVKGNVISIEWADKFLDDITKYINDNNAYGYNVIFEYLSEVERKIETYNL